MTITRWRAESAGAGRYGLAEGPVWDALRERVLWVEIDTGAVHAGRLDGGRLVPEWSRVVDRSVGAVVCSAAGELLVAGERRVFRLDADDDGVEVVPAGTPRRLNDGACDPDGRFCVGSMATDDARGGDVLVRVSGGEVTVLDDDLTLSNGMAWTPDGLLYSIDSVPGVLYVRPYERPAQRRELLRFGDDGLPDGMCLDDGGALWIAMYGAGEVRRYTPAGELTGVVEVPAPNVTSVAFVGTGLDRLLITTRDGGLFLAEVGAVGLPVPYWEGPHREGQPCAPS